MGCVCTGGCYTQTVSTDNPFQTIAKGEDYPIPGACGLPGQTYENQCHAIKGGEFEWRKQGSGCSFDSLNPGQELECDRCCSCGAVGHSGVGHCQWAGLRSVCYRSHYGADPLQCAIHGTPNIGDKTCDPVYTDKSSPQYISTMSNYCGSGHLTEPVCRTFCNLQPRLCEQSQISYCAQGNNATSPLCTQFCDLNPTLCKGVYLAYCGKGANLLGSTCQAYIKNHASAEFDALINRFCKVQSVTLADITNSAAVTDEQRRQVLELCACNLNDSDYATVYRNLVAEYPALGSVSLGNPRCLIPSCVSSSFPDSTIRSRACPSVQCIQNLSVTATGSIGAISANQTAECGQVKHIISTPGSTTAPAPAVCTGTGQSTCPSGQECVDGTCTPRHNYAWLIVLILIFLFVVVIVVVMASRKAKPKHKTPPKTKPKTATASKSKS